MATSSSSAETLGQIGPCLWEIPQSYKTGMRVPGRVYASRGMLDVIQQDQALEQVVNVAMLPGIVGASLAMPDIHWGYGFPVGGVAAMRADEGVISPGGIGYDINCLPGRSRILHEFGYHRPISEFAQCWPDERIQCIVPGEGPHGTEIAGYLERQATSALLRLTTVLGQKILATPDHPLLTDRGMIPLGTIQPGDRVAVYPFEGVRYEAPSPETLVEQAHVASRYPGPATGLTQLTRALYERGLLPLKLNHPKLPHLIKLLGFVQGDGCITFLRRGGTMTAFYGDPNDLKDVQRDIAALGFIPSRVYQRTRDHQIDTGYRTTEFTRTESSVHCGSTALAVLLCCLGAVAGNKTRQAHGVPAWLGLAPLWMKRLYLAALFGAELTAPQTVSGHGYNFVGPVLSQNKSTELVSEGQRHLTEIQAWLAQFGVKSSLLRLTSAEEYTGRNGSVSVRVRLQVGSTADNLIRLWTRVGFEYNRRKQYLANVAVQYLRAKTLVLEERAASIKVARELHSTGMRAEAIVTSIGSPYVNLRFVERSIWNPRKTTVRVASAFPSFQTFLNAQTKGLEQSGQVWDRVSRVEAIPLICPVYDFTVENPSHNFIADGFVVSNCGVRLVATELRDSEVKRKLDTLADTLYQTVPTGTGSGSNIKVRTREDFDQVLCNGARWAVEAGYGDPRDLEYIEEGGRLAGADPDTIGQRARDRGMQQVGSLGSGNHFLEVQEVEEIYEEETARAFGLRPRQVVVFIHTGSRGFGHQVCTDALHAMSGTGERYGIELPDRQLACAPIASEEGQWYLAAMACAANFAWANRQCITHWARQVLLEVFGRAAGETRLVYDVSHNIAKFERYSVDGTEMEVCVHRKGATRAFPAGHPELSPAVRPHGQPVLIPGDMGRYSYVAVGTDEALRQSFGSTCHGAGRLRSRGAARRLLEGVDVRAELKRRGIVVRAQNPKLLAEEASEAYKDVADVVDVVQQAGISRKVARMRPLAVIKG